MRTSTEDDDDDRRERNPRREGEQGRHHRAEGAGSRRGRPGCRRIGRRGEAAPRDLTELSLEQLLEVEIPSLYAASRFDQKVTEAPSSVTIVTSAEIERYGYRTLADLLRAVRGFYTSYDRNYTYIGVRGFSRPGDYNTRILLLLDGHRVNDNIFDSVLAGTEGILDLVDRAEIVRGPASSLYGTNAFFAVVHVVTRATAGQRSGAASAEAASCGTYRGRLQYSAPLGEKRETLVSASVDDSRGQRLFFPGVRGPLHQQRVRGGGGRGPLRAAVRETLLGGVTISALHSFRTKAIPTASFGTLFNDPRSETTDSRSHLDVRADGAFRERLDWLVRAAVDRYVYEGTYVYDYPPVTLNRDGAFGWWWTVEGQTSARLGAGHRVTAGIELRDNVRQDQDNYDEGTGTVYVDSDTRSRNGSLYVQEEFEAGKKFLLSAGIRYDRYSTWGGKASPRLALVFRSSPRWSAKLLYGEAFRAPNAYELYFYGTGPDGLEPETITTHELAFDAFLAGNVYLAASVFHYEIGDLISLGTDPATGAFFYRNLERAEAQGVELEAGKTWPTGLEVRASYSRQRAEEEAAGQILSNSPRLLAHLHLGKSWFDDRLFTGISGGFKGRGRTVRGSDVGSSATFDLTASVRRIARKLELTAGIYNALDKANADPPSEEHVQHAIPQDGRSFFVRLTYRFRTELPAQGDAGAGRARSPSRFPVLGTVSRLPPAIGRPATVTLRAAAPASGTRSQRLPAPGGERGSGSSDRSHRAGGAGVSLPDPSGPARDAGGSPS